MISIHVPAWGTTVWNSTCPKRTPISIHVPAWGTTKKEIDGLIFVEISIHVPAWGTTNWQNNIFYELIYFNPRSRVGNDKVNYEWLTEGTGFQSTFPRGERPNATKSSELPCQFQSTFPRGERPTQMRNNDANHDFNPRSRVGNDCK